MISCSRFNSIFCFYWTSTVVSTVYSFISRYILKCYEEIGCIYEELALICMCVFECVYYILFCNTTLCIN